MWQCGLCSHIYDESKESIPWGQLPDEWVCPICGSPKSSFVPLQAQSDTPPADPSPCPADDPCARYQCDLCSHIYDEAREYGVTCHHMNPKVDTGAIVAVRRFDVVPGDTVYSVTQRCYTSMLPLFCEVMTQWLTSGTLPTSTEAWGREAYRRSELNALCRVDSPKILHEIPNLQTSWIRRTCSYR